MSYVPSSGGVTDGDKGDVTVSGSGATWLVTSVASEVVVKSASDFPTPSGGVITLADNTAYLITGTVDIGTDRIVCGIKNTITGIDRQNDILISSTTGNMFTMDNSATPKVTLIFDTLTLKATAGTLISVSGGTTDQVTFISVTVSSTLTGGTMSGVSFSMRTSSLSSAFSVGGFTFTGTNTSFVLRDSTVSNNTGTAFNMTSATFTSALLIARNYILTNASQTFLNGTGLTTTFGQLALCIFSGAGTQFTSVTGETANWLWSNNQGITNSNSTYLPSITGNALKVLRVNAGATATEWTSPSAGSLTITQTEIDFGSVPLKMKKFTITDASVTASMKIIPTMSYDNPTDGEADSAEWFEDMTLSARADTGQFFLYCNSPYQDLNGKVKVNYIYA